MGLFSMKRQIFAITILCIVVIFILLNKLVNKLNKLFREHGTYRKELIVTSRFENIKKEIFNVSKLTEIFPKYLNFWKTITETDKNTNKFRISNQIF